MLSADHISRSDFRTVEKASIDSQKGSSEMNVTNEPQVKNLPLRAFSYRELNAAAWSHGETWGTYERKERQNALPAVENMTLAELERTQNMEPESESRKSFYATGQGVLSLDALAMEHDAARYGVPYETVDPITQKQIAWEQRAYYTSPVVTARRLPDGKVALSRYTDKRTFHAIREAMAEYGIGSGPTPKARLTTEAFREAKRRSAEVTYAEIRRQTAPADEIWHGAYEVTHEGEIVATVTSGPRRQSTWHHNALDTSELEIGFDLMADEDLEAELGEDAMPLPLLKENAMPPKNVYSETSRITGGTDIADDDALSAHVWGGGYVEDTRADMGYGEDEDPECVECGHALHPNYECRNEHNQPRSCGCDERTWEFRQSVEDRDNSGWTQEEPLHTAVTSVRQLRPAGLRGEWRVSDVFDADPNVVYIGMPGKAAAANGITDDHIGPFGKPWECLRDPRGWEIAYREYLWARIKADADFALAVRDLHGKTLVCWCKGREPLVRGKDRCHGDSLSAAAEWLFHGMQSRKKQ